MHGYDETKAAQVAAFFALRAGGRVNVLKLAKLLYLAERESMKRFDEPMFYDRLVSMDHGPVTSISLNHVNDLGKGTIWPIFIKGRMGHDVVAADGLTMSDLVRLSPADLQILNDLWTRFGDWDRFRLADWTHANCPEWEDPQGSSTPIPHVRVFKFLNKRHPEELAAEVESHRFLDRALTLA